MDKTVLEWKRFDSFLKAQEASRRKLVDDIKGKEKLVSFPCIYAFLDREEKIVLRIGETGAGLLKEYKTGVRYVIEAAMHGSGNRVYVAEAPADKSERKAIQDTLIYNYQPRFNEQEKKYRPTRPVNIEHRGDIPRPFTLTGSH